MVGLNKNKIDIDNITLNITNTAMLVFVNGIFAAQYSKVALLDTKIIFTNLKTAQTKYVDLLNQFSLQSLTPNDGYFIFVPPNTDVTSILHIAFISSNNQQSTRATTTNCYNLVIAAENSKVQIFEEFLGVNSETSINNINTQLIAQNAAHVTYHKIQNENLTSDHHAKLTIQQFAKSTVKTNHILRGAHSSTETLDHIFAGEYATFAAGGLYLLKQNQTSNIKLTSNYKYSNCNSNVLFKGLLNDNASGAFTGKIIVDANTHKNEAHLNNNNILLSESAYIKSAPELEIYTDDVKCKHGSTTGQLDTNALFYLQTRGLAIAEAQELLIKGFTQEMIDKLPKVLQQKLQKV
jgi:Fe-S cluster assembly protein SufD